ncbi:MFS transporter [Nocardioides sp. C4-1]|uniref:MFS transporter n=1 Tax=Nocardioides sp. C4-1 TaxID=3151851 RepID=UPI003262FAAE
MTHGPGDPPQGGREGRLPYDDDLGPITRPYDRDGRPDPQHPGDHPPSGADRARAVGHGLGTGAKATARGVRATARVGGRFGRYAVGQAKRAANAQGAEQSGLNRLIYLHAANAAGDAAVAISLATTVFFAGATSDARGQVALFLGLTMLPFAVVAPLIGPFLDRFSHGRRWAIGATFAIRGIFCLLLAGAVADDSALLYPLALGVLVSSKAYGVTRAAAVPRLLPEDFTLVKANGRVSLAGLVGGALSAPLAGLAATFGAEWTLRYAFLVFAAGTVAAILLPAQVDSTEGEQSVTLRKEDGQRRGTQIPSAVAFALRANVGPRWLSGFLTMYMVFLLRDEPLDGWRDDVSFLFWDIPGPTILLGLVVGGAAAGNAIGIFLASVLKRINPAVTVMVALIADAAILLAGTLFYGVLIIGLLGLVAGLAQSLAKVSLDSTIQSGVPVHVQASAFARSDTTLQLAWVVGGFVGIALPQVPRLGLGIAFAVLAAWTVFVLGSRRSAATGRRPAPPAGRSGPVDPRRTPPPSLRKD